MDVVKAIILGLVQGLTEFLPVSSSGHLVIFAEILNFHEEGVAFEVFVHFGTLLSILFAFRYEILQMIKAPFQVLSKTADDESKEFFRWDLYVIIATIPAAVIGLSLKDEIEAVFSNVLIVFFTLCVTGIIMILTPYLKNRDVDFNSKNTFLIGVAQAFAILPGISRSGSTIFTGMLLGIEREKVARFSFIMSIPAILGAVVLKLSDVLAASAWKEQLTSYISGTVVAFISGYLAIIWLLNLVKKGKLQYFGYYCFIIAFIGFTWYFLFR